MNMPGASPREAGEDTRCTYVNIDVKTPDSSSEAVDVNFLTDTNVYYNLPPPLPSAHSRGTSLPRRHPPTHQHFNRAYWSCPASPKLPPSAVVPRKDNIPCTTTEMTGKDVASPPIQPRAPEPKNKVSHTRSFDLDHLYQNLVRVASKPRSNSFSIDLPWRRKKKTQDTTPDIKEDSGEDWAARMLHDNEEINYKPNLLQTSSPRSIPDVHSNLTTCSRSSSSSSTSGSSESGGVAEECSAEVCPGVTYLRETTRKCTDVRDEDLNSWYHTAATLPLRASKDTSRGSLQSLQQRQALDVNANLDEWLRKERWLEKKRNSHNIRLAGRRQDKFCTLYTSYTSGSHVNIASKPETRDGDFMFSCVYTTLLATYVVGGVDDVYSSPGQLSTPGCGWVEVKNVQEIKMTLTLQAVQLKGAKLQVHQLLYIMMDKPVKSKNSVEVLIEGLNKYTSIKKFHLRNPYTIDFRMPEEFLRGSSLICVTVLVDKKRIGSRQLKCESSMDTLKTILTNVSNPTEFMCQALNINPTSDELDQKLADTVRFHLPPHRLGESNVQNRGIWLQFPTWIHFSAYYGLERLIWALLEIPGGEAALNTTNCHGHTPSVLAYQKHFSTLAQKLEDAAPHQQQFLHIFVVQLTVARAAAAGDGATAATDGGNQQQQLTVVQQQQQLTGYRQQQLTGSRTTMGSSSRPRQQQSAGHSHNPSVSSPPQALTGVKKTTSSDLEGTLSKSDLPPNDYTNDPTHISMKDKSENYNERVVVISNTSVNTSKSHPQLEMRVSELNLKIYDFSIVSRKEFYEDSKAKLGCRASELYQVTSGKTVTEQMMVKVSFCEILKKSCKELVNESVGCKGRQLT
ncbi:uncharacterized protein stumps [Cherax quadricarinatus]|uniref:uncharacterized protein stumps n=1 Tax=Cherax quadricarinatus TaxID=27406 RepID=UPI00387E60CF